MKDIRKTDTIVVGFGLAGALLGQSLTNKGVDFVVVDGNYPKASEVAAGMYNPIVFRRLVKSWLVDDILPFAENFYRDLEERLKVNFFHPVKYFKLLSNDEKEFWEKRSVLTDTKPYLSPDIITLSNNGIKKEFQCAAEVYFAGWLQIGKMLSAYVSELRNGDKIVEKAFDYNKLKLHGDRVVYNDIEAKRVIFCEGSYIHKNPWFNYLPFKSTKGEVLTIRSKALQLDYVVNKNGFVLPIGNDFYRVGATYEWDELDFLPSEQGKTKLIEKLTTVVDVPFEIVDHKAGVRPTTKDRRPVLGAHPENKKLWVFNGLGSKGVMLGPYFANQLVNHIFDGDILNPEVDVDRFNRYLPAIGSE